MSENETKPRWNPWPVSIIAFFSLAIIGSVSFVAFCTRHPVDLVASDYYEQELRYQGQIDKAQLTRQQGSTAKVSYDAAAQQITVRLPHPPATTPATGSIQLYRPSAGKLDRQIKLEPDRDGMQVIDASSLAPGLWKVRVSWKTDHLEYFVDEKVVIAAKAI
jgi:hypothetical protein